jgi:hypothetical protein
MKTALLVIATGERYHQYVNPLLESAKEFFVEHDAFLWADELIPSIAKFQLQKYALGFPNETLYRYHTFFEQYQFLEKYDYLFYIDVDMRFVAPVGEEIFSDGITATLHPGYVGTPGTPERRAESMAVIPQGSNNRYFCGGFNGGTSGHFLRMAQAIKGAVDEDASRGITAIWHDESHLNRYLYLNGPTKVLDPSYCYPENAGPYYTSKWKAAGLIVTPKILALTKAGK